jgi:hypothetical protein
MAGHLGDPRCDSRRVTLVTAGGSQSDLGGFFFFFFFFQYNNYNNDFLFINKGKFEILKNFRGIKIFYSFDRLI